MYRHALAASHVANDLFAANRIATSRAIDQQVVVAAHLDGRGLAAKDATHDAGQTAWFVVIALCLMPGDCARRFWR